MLPGNVLQSKPLEQNKEVMLSPLSRHLQVYDVACPRVTAESVHHHPNNWRTCGHSSSRCCHRRQAALWLQLLHWHSARQQHIKWHYIYDNVTELHNSTNSGSQEVNVLRGLFTASCIILSFSLIHLIMGNAVKTLISNVRTSVLMASRELESRDVPLPIGDCFKEIDN